MVNGNAKEDGKVDENKWDGPFSKNYENENLREKKKYNKEILSGKYNYYFSNGEVKKSFI